jgi:ArsR family transcriptional regulator, arsenate/arsenite/antimonite-responsive transcriptional repressor
LGVGIQKLSVQPPPIWIHYHCIQLSEEKMPSTNSNPSSNRAATPTRLTRARRTTLLKALADPKRFELLERISRATCPLACAVVGEALAISPATLSHHIKELQTSGLIDVRREGKFHFLSIRPGVLEALAATLQSLSPTSCPTR